MIHTYMLFSIPSIKNYSYNETRYLKLVHYDILCSWMETAMSYMLRKRQLVAASLSMEGLAYYR